MDMYKNKKENKREQSGTVSHAHPFALPVVDEECFATVVMVVRQQHGAGCPYLPAAASATLRLVATDELDE